MSTVLELFRRAIQRKQFKSVTYSDVKVHLFDFPIRSADLTTVNLSPAHLSHSPPPPSPSLTLPLPPSLSHSPPTLSSPFSFRLLISFSFPPSYFITAHANLVRSKCQLRERYPPSIPFLLTSPRGGVSAVVMASFTSASGVPKIDRREAGESYEETILIWKSGEIAKNQ